MVSSPSGGKILLIFRCEKVPRCVGGAAGPVPADKECVRQLEKHSQAVTPDDDPAQFAVAYGP